jgi:hypothetical protein
MNTTVTTTPAAFCISATGKQHGYGCDRYKSVTCLTADEKARAAAGERVFFRAGRRSHATSPAGTFWRVVKVWAGEYYPRVPTKDEVAALRAATGRV